MQTNTKETGKETVQQEAVLSLLSDFCQITFGWKVYSNIIYVINLNSKLDYVRNER